MNELKKGRQNGWIELSEESQNCVACQFRADDNKSSALFRWWSTEE